MIYGSSQEFQPVRTPESEATLTTDQLDTVYATEYDASRLIAAANQLPAIDADIADKGTAREIITSGTVEGRPIGLADVLRNGSDEVDERLYLAGLLLTGEQGRESARAIVRRGVCGFHATRSQALAGILERGSMRSGARLQADGDLMVTGEHIFQRATGQDSISFSNLAHTRDVILQHAGPSGIKVRDQETLLADIQQSLDETAATLASFDTSASGTEAQHLGNMVNRHRAALESLTTDPHSLFATLSRHEFPVLLGINKDFVADAEERRESGHLLRGASHLGEFRPAADEISLDDLPVIAVPSEAIAPVKTLLQEFGYPDAEVIPLEALAA